MHHLELSLEDQESSFIKKALRVTSFNMNVNEFATLKHKKEIQWLYGTIVLSNPSGGSFFVDSIEGKNLDIGGANSIIKNMKKSSNFEKVYREGIGTNASAFGPGELMFYLIFDEVSLMGGTGSGDLVGLSESYELKSANYIRKLDAYGNINFGGTVKAGFDEVCEDMLKLAKDLNYKPITNKTNMGIVAINGLEETEKERFKKEGKTAKVIPTFAQGDFLLKLNKNRYDIILEKFRKISYDKYVSKHPLVVLSNLKSNNNYGEIAGILRANSADDLKTKLFIHEVTQGVLKPRIKL